MAKAVPRHWLKSLAFAPAAIVAFLPSATCPMCIAAYAGALSAIGLGVVFNAQVQVAVMLTFLVIGVGTVAWSARSHGQIAPTVVSAVGALAFVGGRIVWTSTPLLYAGVALLLAGSLWNLWLKRPQPDDESSTAGGAGRGSERKVGTGSSEG
ncbi:MAG: hypothetical protein NVS2B9_04020 [Myxococcales bacterium]